MMAATPASADPADAVPVIDIVAPVLDIKTGTADL